MKQLNILVFLITMIAVIPATALAVEILEKVESEVYQTEGSKLDIAKRGKMCIVANLNNDVVKTGAGTSILDALAGGSNMNKQEQLAGGDLFVDIDLEGGIITANSRVDYRSKLLGHNAKSIFTFFAKEGRFKMRHTRIDSMQMNTGNIKNSGYSQVYKQWGSGWKVVVKTLEEVSAKVAECVMNGTEEEDW